MRVIYPPEIYIKSPGKLSIFLAGSIEMGLAEEWQNKVIEALSKFDIDILNPRRVDWDSSWEQSIDNKPFLEQVTWELDNLEQADLILFYFAENTKSPVSLLELGRFSTTGKVICCCPAGFWRKGNVDIVCERYHSPVYEDLDDLIDMLELSFENWRI